MSLHKQIRFSVRPDAVDGCVDAIREYADYVGDWVMRHGPEWRWATYQDAETPTSFVSVMWHASRDAEMRHRNADGTQRFADRLYPHVTANDERVFELIADSTRRSGDGNRS